MERPTLHLNLVQKIHNHIALVDRLRVEILSYRQRQLVLGDSPLVLPACHCGREFADSRFEDDMCERVVKGRRLRQAVECTVRVEEFGGFGSPRYLYVNEQTD